MQTAGRGKIQALLVEHNRLATDTAHVQRAYRRTGMESPSKALIQAFCHILGLSATTFALLLVAVAAISSNGVGSELSAIVLAMEVAKPFVSQ